ncbi:taste receptor type 1 member 2 [Python bivittatus]|uniref:Taste receptor type 1 member 2 n=1 Tax=Python bivittatus TaxID=176946 RepID=A0A9F2R592_PYTBI|nr:taste receptor type 1 member 2 [Python bivittatus]
MAGYSYFQAMRFAVEEINNSPSLLPGVRLGYEMIDNCYLANTVHPVLYFLADNRSTIQIQRNYTSYRPRVIAVIGPDSSPAAVTVAYILSHFLVPQVTYSATTEALSDPGTFPVTFRTIPSAEQQIVVILRLLRHFRWNWFIVLSSDDEYGHQNLQLLRFQAPRACLALQETLPVQRRDPQVWGSPVQEKIRAAVARIRRSTAKVVVVLSLELPLPAFFEEALGQNLTGLVWIAAEAWATDLSLHNIHNVSSLGTIFGVAVQDVPVPGLDDFRVGGPSGASGDPKEPASGSTCNQVCQECLPTVQLYDKSLRQAGNRIDFNVYSAVYVAAHALHRLLSCNDTGCQKKTVYPWQLLNEIGRVNFTLLNTTINFDKKGDPPNGFEVVQWRWDLPGKPFERVATYDSLEDKLSVLAGSIAWQTPDNTAPKSVCSEQCSSGWKKKQIGSLSCCFECVECEAGTFLNDSDSFTCQRCPLDMWSHPGREECFPKLVVYLQWGHPVSVALLLLSALGFSATLGILATFARHASTPVVKSAGGKLCFLMLSSLVLGFCSVFSYVGVPTELRCLLRQVGFSLCFTVCISCATVRAFQILCAFKVVAWLPTAFTAWATSRGQWAFIATVSAAKVAVLMLNLWYHYPRPVKAVVKGSPAELFLTCHADHLSAVAASHAFDMVLSFVCFCLAYAGKGLPKSYNEAKYITVIMVCYFSSWVLLVLVVTVSEGTVVTVLDMAVVLSNLLSLSLGYFGPKCYVIYVHPERNTPAFFQAAIQSYTMDQG